MTHTKGPWVTDSNGVITGGDGFTTSIATTPAAEWRRAADSLSIGDARLFTLDCLIESLHNAKLIAAAPELLDAAMWMVEVTREPSESFDDSKDFYHALERLKQAINKAKGE